MWQCFKKVCVLIKNVSVLSSVHLINYLQYTGWKIIYSNLDGGQVMLKRLRLVERAKSNPAFAVISNQLQMVVLRGDLPEKEQRSLLLHEIGHILLGHNLSCLSVAEEREAGIFTIIGLSVYKLWDYRWWISAAGAAVILLMIFGLFSTDPTSCEHCLHHK